MLLTKINNFLWCRLVGIYFGNYDVIYYLDRWQLVQWCHSDSRNKLYVYCILLIQGNQNSNYLFNELDLIHSKMVYNVSNICETNSNMRLLFFFLTHLILHYRAYRRIILLNFLYGMFNNFPPCDPFGKLQIQNQMIHD